MNTSKRDHGLEPDRRSVLLGALGAPLIAIGQPRGRTPLVDPVRLAHELGQAPAEDARALVAKAMRDGLSVRDLNGAVLLAALTDILPRPLGGPLHAVMVIESAVQLTEGRREEERFRAALWCLEDYLAYRDRVRGDGVWRLPPAPPRDIETERAGGVLTEALSTWDAESAEHALVSMADVPADAIFDRLRAASFRSFAGLGHKLLYAVQLERVLPRVDSRLALPALRSLVRCLLDSGSDSTDADERRDAQDTGSYEHALERTRDWPDDWERPENDERALPAIVRAFRTASPASAQETLAQRIEAGLGVETAWNALRLVGTDTFLRRPASSRRRHTPVHTVTELNAFDTTRRRVRDPRMRAHLLLQAAAWLVRIRLVSEERWGPSEENEGVFAEPEAGRPRSGEELFRVATQDHHWKYAAAAHEEARRAPACYRARILVAGEDYLPDASGALAPRAAHALEVLARGGRG